MAPLTSEKKMRGPFYNRKLCSTTCDSSKSRKINIEKKHFFNPPGSSRCTQKETKVGEQGETSYIQKRFHPEHSYAQSYDLSVDFTTYRE